MSGMDSYYAGWNSSNYAKTNTEYTGSNGTVGATSAYSGHFIDTSAASGGGNTSAILAEVCKQVTAGHIVPDPTGNGYYPVYTDVPRGNAGYCAWHSAGSCGGKAVQFAFFLKLDGDAGCDPPDTTGRTLARTGGALPTSADTNCRSAAPIRQSRVRGTTPAAPRMATSAPGRLTFRS